MTTTENEADDIRRTFRLFPDGVLVALLAFCLLLLFRDILPARSQRRALEDQIEHLEARSIELEEECRHTEVFSESLRHDPTTIERVLRKEFRLSRPGEKVLRFGDE